MPVPTIVSSTTIASNLPFWGTFVDTDVSFNNPTTGFFTVQNGTGLHIGSGVVIFAAHTLTADLQPSSPLPPNLSVANIPNLT